MWLFLQCDKTRQPLPSVLPQENSSVMARPGIFFLMGWASWIHWDSVSRMRAAGWSEDHEKQRNRNLSWCCELSGRTPGKVVHELSRKWICSPGIPVLRAENNVQGKVEPAQQSGTDQSSLKSVPNIQSVVRHKHHDQDCNGFFLAAVYEQKRTTFSPFAVWPPFNSSKL